MLRAEYTYTHAGFDRHGEVKCTKRATKNKITETNREYKVVAPKINLKQRGQRTKHAHAQSDPTFSLFYYFFDYHR